MTHQIPLKLTINYKTLSRIVIDYRHELTDREMMNTIGEAVFKSIENLRCFSECNDEICIDQKIEDFIICDIANRKAKENA